MTPKKRAAYGTGTKPAQRPDGLYVARIEAGYTASGARRRIVVSAKTETECKRRLKKKMREIAEHGLPAAGTARATVKSWADEWLPIYRGEVKPTTYVTNSGLVRKWIVPTMGAKRLTDLTPADVRAMHRAITKAGKSTTTAGHAHVVLIRMLKAAVVEGHRVPASIFEVKHPAAAVSDRDAIPTDQARRILEHAAGRDDFARWVACILQGMRQGEVLGLTWDAVDLERATVDVSWQLQTLPYADKRSRAAGFIIPAGYEARHLTGAAHLVRPKSTRGRRVIPLVAWLHGELVAYRARWVPNPWGLVWTDTNGKGETIPRRATQDRETWHDLQALAEVKHPAGRPYHLHEARHTTATLLLEEGVDEAIIKAIMGHSSIVVTRGYQHVSQDLARIALERATAKLTPRAIEG